MKLFPTKCVQPTPTRCNRWLWFIGLYCVSLIVVGSIMTLTHWLGSVLVFLSRL